MRPPWRRAKSGADEIAADPLSPALAPPSDRTSDESAAPAAACTPSSSSGSAHAPARPGPLQRISGMFKDPDGRVEENLRSMKRRVVQVRRQPDHAPVRFQMGFRSRTGWEPIRAAKENQDCLVALVPWGPASTYNLFAALDGHGRNGHQCAIFVAQKVVAYLNRMLPHHPNRDAVARCMHKSILYAERKLEAPPHVRNYELSGSTGVFVLIHGATLYCANVGDSRALIGREKETRVGRVRRSPLAPASTDRHHKHGKPPKKKPLSAPGTLRSPRYLPVPLSVDQKPSRADEKERLLAAGARVDAWEGVDVGEERVWLPEARTPGLAVSRSFGDLIVKQYGVDCTPEVYTLDLSEDDRFLVMASDGVFEFMSNKEVVDVVGRWRERGSAQEAAEELVKLATERWILDDSVIDDISCVVVFMNVVTPSVPGPRDPVLVETNVGSADTASETDNSPASRNMSQNLPGSEDLHQESPGFSDAVLLDERRIDGEPNDLDEVIFEDDEGIDELAVHVGRHGQGNDVDQR